MVLVLGLLIFIAVRLLKKEFENLANRIFEDKSKVLGEQNRERIDE